MKCLLCDKGLKTELNFTSLLCFKKEEELVCESCLLSFEIIGDNHCPRCFKKDVSTNCQDCQFWCKKGVNVDHVALYSYNQAMKEYFSRYKFDGDYILRKVFSKILQKELKKYTGYQIVIVPLSEQRFKSRGFNQVEGLIKETGLSYLDILAKNEVEASSSKNRADRLLTEFPFFLKDGVKLPENILLFDDIYTTGSTLNRLKSMLLAAGCQNIKTFSLAR